MIRNIRKIIKNVKKDDIFGISGSISLLTAYGISTNQLCDNKIIIDMLNLYGSAGVGYNCYCKKAIPPLLLELSWFSIASLSLLKHL